MAIEGKERSLEETPTWAVALVCAVFIIISILIEHGIHSLGKWFEKKHKKSMLEALEKIKAELMLLGFISLLLTVSTAYITKICVPLNVGETMLPCGKDGYSKHDEGEDDSRRKLLSISENFHDLDGVSWHRMLAGADKYAEYCSGKNKVTLISYKGLHQLHIFIFVLALFHVFYSVLIILLSEAKIKKWKGWESETSSLEYEFTNDPSRFRFTNQTSFVRRHAGIARMPGLRWIVAFFRQFSGSVSKVDYMTMRLGFINAHFAPNSKFDFHKYIKRSMEDDFKVVVGISISLWIYAIILLFLNVYRWHILTWVSFIPLAILLSVGTKLELVIMEMAQQIEDRTTVVRGAPIVEPSNSYFWFNNPHWVLVLIHFTSFQNAFQMAYFLWAWYEFGFYSCHRETLAIIVFRVTLGIALQFICSYITFPLYVLVTQMGSHMKKAIFEEQTAKALRKWQKTAKERRKVRTKEGAGDISHSGFTSGNTTPSRGSSPIHLLHKFKNYKPSHATSASPDQRESVTNSPYNSDMELSESEYVSQPTFTPRRIEENHQNDFSFDKP